MKTKFLMIPLALAVLTACHSNDNHSTTPATTAAKSAIKAPEAKAPEAKAPEAKAPEAKAPEAKAPEAKAPEAKAPEAKAPVTQPTKVDTPKTAAPKTEAPKTAAPKTEAPKTEAPKTAPAKVAPPKPVINGVLGDDLESSTLSESWVKYSGGSDAMGLTTAKANGGTQSLLIKDSSTTDETHVALLFKDQKVKNGTVTFDTLIPSSNDDDTYFVLSDTTNPGFYTLHLKDEDLYLEGNHGSKLVGHVSRDKWHTISMKWDHFSGNYTTSVDGGKPTTVMIFTLDQFVNRVDPSQLLIKTGSETGTGNNVYIDNVAFNLDGKTLPKASVPGTSTPATPGTSTPDTSTPAPAKAAPAEPVGVLGDNFEGEKFSKYWMAYSGDATCCSLSDKHANTGSKSLLIKDVSAAGNATVALQFKKAHAKEGTVAFDAYVPNTNTKDAYFLLNEGEGLPNVKLHLKGDDLILEGPDSTVNVGKFSRDAWHAVSIEWDFTKYVITLDGHSVTALLYKIGSFAKTNPSQFTVMVGDTANTGDEVYLDNVAFQLEGEGDVHVQAPAVTAPTTPAVTAPTTPTTPAVSDNIAGDDFESYNVGDVVGGHWKAPSASETGMSATITDEKANGGSKSLVLKDLEAKAKPYATLPFVSEAKSGSVSVDAFFPADNKKFTYIKIGKGSANDDRYLEIKQDGTKLLIAHKDKHDETLKATLTLDAWHTFKITWTESNTYTITLDGTDLVKDADQTATGYTGIIPTELRLYTGDSKAAGNVAYFDNVKSDLFEAPAATAPVTPTPAVTAPVTPTPAVTAPVTPTPAVTELVTHKVTEPVTSSGVFGDNMEGAKINASWKAYTGEATCCSLSDKHAKTGSHSLLIKDTSASAKATVSLLFKKASVKDGTVTFDTFVPDTNSEDTYFVLNTGTGDAAFKLHLKGEELFVEGDNTSQKVADFTRNAWHTISMQWDFNNLITVVDGATPVTAPIFVIQPVGQNPSQFTVIAGAIANTDDEVYIDNVAFKLEGEEQTQAPAVTEPTTAVAISGDDFESYAIGDTVGGQWNAPDASQTGKVAIVTDEVTNGSEKALVLKDNSTSGKPYVSLPFVESNTASGSVSLDAFFPSANADYTYIKIGKSSDNKDRYIEIKQEAQKLLVAHTDSKKDVVIYENLTLDTWHTFNITWTESHTYTITLDGTEIVKDADQNATGYGNVVPTELGLYTGFNSGTGNVAYFDNVKSDLF
ncbi:hypothetical protein [Vibrio rarus]|uniref:hypothetical protein n=1 Tax=Vibrio rarus TaxID=413403 RepID=UPI0021C2A702|nr:hypothetical protein [Vibrio rarus]